MKRGRDVRVDLFILNQFLIFVLLKSIDFFLCIFSTIFSTASCSHPCSGPTHPVETKAAAAVESDKMKHRLEQLDDLEDGGTQETLNLSQQDYVDKIDTMNRSLTGAWQKDQRVLALKITIQVCVYICSCMYDDFVMNKYYYITIIILYYHYY